VSNAHPDIAGGVQRIAPIAANVLFVLSLLQGAIWWGDSWLTGVLSAIATLFGAQIISLVLSRMIGRHKVPFFVAPELNALIYTLIAEMLSFAMVFVFTRMITT